MTLNITQKQDEIAKHLCLKIRDGYLRERAYLNFLATAAFSDIMLNNGVIVNTKRSLLNSFKLYEDFEVADVSCNYHKIYVLYSDNSEYIKIPKKHKEFNILPEYYAVIEVDTSSKTTSFIGGINPVDTGLLESDGEYFLFPKNSIKSLKYIEKLVESPMQTVHPKGKHLDCIKLFDSYVTNSITKDEKKQMIEHVLYCETCKKKLLETLELKEGLINRDKANAGIKNEVVVDPIIFGDDSTSEKFSQIKSVLDLFYKDKDKNKLSGAEFLYKVPNILKAKKAIIFGSFIIFLLFIFIISAITMPKTATIKENNTIEETALLDETSLTDENQNENDDIKIPSINQNKTYATVNGVSWEVSSNISKESQKKFLQQMGKNIRLNLQNDLLLSSGAIINSKVQFEIIYNKNGDIESIENIKSSGSPAIDDVIKRSIEETMKYAKPPKNSFVGKKGALTLNIQF